VNQKKLDIAMVFVTNKNNIDYRSPFTEEIGDQRIYSKKNLSSKGKVITIVVIASFC